MLHENKELKEPKLLHLDLETSSYCNFNCKICPRPKENGIMPTEDIKRIIKEFADLGGETVKPFWRGEPFADQRMPEILKYAKEYSLKTMINTNGSDPRGIYKDCLSCIDWISFSIDEQHGNIDNEAYKNLFTAEGLSAIEDVEVQAASINSFVSSTCEATGIPYKIDLPTKRSEDDSESETLNGERKYCGFPDWRMIIDWQGNAKPCCVCWGDKDLIMGNIYKQSLEEIFYGRIFSDLRESLNESIFTYITCKECPSRSAYVS